MEQRRRSPHPLSVLLVVLATLAGLSWWAATPPAGAATPAVAYVQGAAASSGGAQATQTLTFTKPVPAGDLLVGWFAQYNAAGPVTVSDGVNGAWTRSASEAWSSGAGDIALYFVAHSAAAPSGLTITVTASSPTYLQSSAAEYGGVTATNPLDQAVVARGVGATVTAGPTNPVPAGELVYSALTTGGSPGTVVPGASGGAAFTARAATSSGSAYEQDITSAPAGGQTGTATLGTSTDWYAVTATFAVGATAPAQGSATFDQGTSVASGSKATTTTMVLSQPVHPGDLLVGWFAQFDVPGQVSVSDNLNGTWTRAGGSLTFQNDSGDIALYYLADARGSPAGVTITVSVPTAAYLQGTVADYSGMALAGPLDQLASARGVGTSVSTGPTASAGAGELVYSAVLTGGSPGAVTPGASQGVPYVTRSQTAGGSSYEQDILGGIAGAQTGTATLASSTDWYAVAAAFHTYPTTDTTPPGPPSNLASTSVATSRVALRWSPGSGDLTGYTVYRNGTPVGTAPPGQTTYLDTTVTASSRYSYTVDAFDGAGLHSTPTPPVVVQTPPTSPTFVQGIAASPGTRSTSLTLTLTKPVAAGDLLVGWFGQYAVAGQVRVADNVNGSWTRSVSEPFTSGTGDIALEYVAHSKAAPTGLTITVSASAPAYLQEAIAAYRGISAAAPLANAVVANGPSAAISVGPTASVPAGDLLVVGTITAGQPGSITPGASQGVPAVVDVQNGSASSTVEDVVATAAGPQTGTATLASGSTWYSVAAVFKP